MLATPRVRADQSSASVVATASFTSRTSLTVSTSTLRFQIVDPSKPARVTVEFEAGARRADRDEIVLTTHDASLSDFIRQQRIQCDLVRSMGETGSSTPRMRMERKSCEAAGRTAEGYSPSALAAAARTRGTRNGLVR